MEISYHTIDQNLDATRGFGNAGFQVVRSLQELGHTVPFNKDSSQVQLSFNHPVSYEFADHQYKIGYTPWESTEIPEFWRSAMNGCDEVWATSPWVADVFRNNGVKKPLYVYEHGLDPKWQRMDRTIDGVVKFLHIGEPALRKGGQMAVDAFRAAFGNRRDVHLTVKCYYQHHLLAWTPEGLMRPNFAFDNVTVITENLSSAELRNLYQDHHAMVYPTYGEGFGLIPLQALGTGMPVISTAEWAPYKEFLSLRIPARLDRSVWSVHPGNVYYPDYDHLVDLYRETFKSIEFWTKVHQDQVDQVHAKNNWLTKTNDVFQSLEKRLTET